MERIPVSRGTDQQIREDLEYMEGGHLLRMSELIVTQLEALRKEKEPLAKPSLDHPRANQIRRAA